MKKSCDKNIITILDIKKDDEYESLDEDVIKLKKTEKKLIKNKAKTIMENKAEELFSYIPDNISKFYKEMINEYENVPILSSVDPKLIYDKLNIISNYDLNNIINLIKIRYKNKLLVKEEKKNMLELSDIICTNLVQEKRKIKDILFLNLSNEIKNIF